MISNICKLRYSEILIATNILPKHGWDKKQHDFYYIIGFCWSNLVIKRKDRIK